MDVLLLVSAALTPYLERHETAVAACCYPVLGVMRLPINSSTHTLWLTCCFKSRSTKARSLAPSTMPPMSWMLASVVAAGAAASPGEVDAGVVAPLEAPGLEPTAPSQ